MRATDLQGKPVELTKIAGDCYQNDCPAVLLTDRGTVAVQGYTLHGDTPPEEGLLELPLDVLLEAARALLR